MIAVLMLSGCATQEDTGHLVGAALLGGLCLALVNPGSRGACVAAAAAGFVVGGAIGKNLDVRDRQRREAAVNAALISDDMWRNRNGGQALSQTELNAKPVDKAAPSNQAAVEATSGWTNPDSDAREWHNPDTSNSGRIEPLRDFRSTNGTECRQFRETYFKQNNQPSTGTSVFCKDAQGSWKEQSSS